MCVINARTSTHPDARILTPLPAEGFDEVLLPGEPEARAEARAGREGVPLPATVHQELLDLARRLGVEAAWAARP